MPSGFYAFSGRVQRGKGMGRTLGFPTANLSLGSDFPLVHGVYAAMALLDGDWVPAIANVGEHPTLPEGPPTVEVHLLGAYGDLYDQVITIRLIHYLRGEKRFDSLEDLKAQVAEDIKRVRGFYAQGASSPDGS